MVCCTNARRDPYRIADYYEMKNRSDSRDCGGSWLAVIFIFLDKHLSMQFGTVGGRLPRAVKEDFTVRKQTNRYSPLDAGIMNMNR